MNTIVYTCITGGYDKLTELKTAHRAICFTDQDIVSNTWEIIKITFEPKIYRKIKICPHLFLPPHDRNVWIDGNLTSSNIDEVINDKIGFWAMTHPSRNCVYQEAIRCIEVGKDTEETLMKQANKYYIEGYPFGNGMITSSFLVRDNNTENKRFGNLWWKEVKNHSVRDQVSFNYVAWKTGLKYKTFAFLQGLQHSNHLNEGTKNL